MKAATAKTKTSPPTATEDPAPATLRFERRTAERWAAIGRLEAMRSDGLAPPQIFQLDLIDESARGLAAATGIPLPPGSSLSVRTSPGLDNWRRGVVVRCVPTGRGYRIGVAYELRRAA